MFSVNVRFICGLCVFGVSLGRIFDVSIFGYLFRFCLVHLSLRIFGPYLCRLCLWVSLRHFFGISIFAYLWDAFFCVSIRVCLRCISLVFLYLTILGRHLWRFYHRISLTLFFGISFGISLLTLGRIFGVFSFCFFGAYILVFLPLIILGTNLWRFYLRMSRGIQLVYPFLIIFTMHLEVSIL